VDQPGGAGRHDLSRAAGRAGRENGLPGGAGHVNDRRVSSAAQLPWRPVVPGDVPAMTELFAEVEEADRYGWHFEADFLARWLADPLIDLAHGTMAAFDGDQMAAAGVLAARTEADPVHAMHYEGGVHPAYRGRGLGAALLDWAVGAAIPLHAARFPGQPLSVQCGFPLSDGPAADLFVQQGFAPVRYFRKMTRQLSGELPPARVPDGIEIVSYRADLNDAMRLAKNEAFREHWDSTPTTAEAWRTRYTGPEFRPELSPLALDAATGQVVGLVLTHEHPADDGTAGRPDAHLNDVATLQPARGRGVASALLATMLGAARECGFVTASLQVDSENLTGALGVYERSGFEVVDTWVTYARDVEAAG
jgi:mycothiol synthase